MAQSTYIARKGEDADFATLTATAMALTGNMTYGASADGVDVTFYGDTASAFAQWDTSADAFKISGDARLDLSSATVAAANTDGGVIKIGTSAAPVTEDTANMKFVSMYFDDGATSGDATGQYLRLYITGAGGGGQAGRIFTSVNNVAGASAYGAHISLSFGTTGSITGLGVANRNTLHVPAAMTAGTYFVNQQEFWADATTSDLAGVTLQGFTNYNLGGDGTGAALIEDSVNLFAITGGTIASGNLVEADADETKFSHKIRINIYGSTYYLMATAT